MIFLLKYGTLPEEIMTQNILTLQLKLYTTTLNSWNIVTYFQQSCEKVVYLCNGYNQSLQQYFNTKNFQRQI